MQCPSKIPSGSTETYSRDVLVGGLRNGFDRIGQDLVFGIHLATVTHFQNYKLMTSAVSEC